ncbi:DinB family protein [uncultured Tenacibaculum sp.]|uniref:DinB family protein n=1 Tax=uncultured Tenacibaculum sp. TaxID=174713 RepID=UPI0026329B9C|nr:DinB family protein [uncultured Tenacibaculum sp.]
MQKNGMLVALLEEYKRATKDYIRILNIISEEGFLEVRDNEAKDPDCKSIQTVTFHIIQSGYTYANYIQSVSNNRWLEYKTTIDTTKNAIHEIEEMLKYTEESFHDNWYKSNEELEKYSFKTRWNVTYDLEQLLEHAIVHILRHRRQVENFLKKD